MLDLILVHSLFAMALVYLGWRFFGRGRKSACGSCPSCPAQAKPTDRSRPVHLTINVTTSSSSG
jgi:hypothetical protein